MSFTSPNVVMVSANLPEPDPRLKVLLQTLSIQRGRFILASGQSSDYYIDCRKSTLDGLGLRLITDWLLPRLYALHVDAIGGLTMGADPLVAGILQASATYGRPLQGFLVRKAAKGHGMQNRIEGHLQPYMRIALLEDVVTTGQSTLEAYEAVQAVYPSVDIASVFAIVDRDAGGTEAFKHLNLPYTYAFAVRDLLM